MRIIYHESRRLIKVKILYDGSKGWMLSWKDGFKVVRGNISEFTKVLQKIKAKDDKQDPHSFRSLTYSNIAKEAANKVDCIIWVWEKDLKKL